MLTCNMYIAVSVPVRARYLIYDILSHLPTRDSFYNPSFFFFNLWPAGPPRSCVRPPQLQFALQSQLSVEVGMNQRKDGRGEGRWTEDLVTHPLTDTHLHQLLPNIMGCFTLSGRLQLQMAGPPLTPEWLQVQRMA